MNAAADDQFLAGASVSADPVTGASEYWISYLTYTDATGPRQLPLITQAIYFQGATTIGATTNSGIDPTSWILRRQDDRCVNVPCYAAGDFNTVASNPYAAATTPFIDMDRSPQNVITHLFQSFVEDPQASPNIPNFKPNFIPFPKGADLRSYGVAFLAGEAGAIAVPPDRKVGASAHP